MFSNGAYILSNPDVIKHMGVQHGPEASMFCVLSMQLAAMLGTGGSGWARDQNMFLSMAMRAMLINQEVQYQPGVIIYYVFDEAISNVIKYMSSGSA